MSQKNLSNVAMNIADTIENIPSEKNQSKLTRLVIIVCALSLATFYSGYIIAYMVALGAKNLSIVYGKSSQIPVVKGFLIASLSFGICFGSFLSSWVTPLLSRRNLVLVLSLIGVGLAGVIQIEHLAALFIVRFFQGTITGLFLVLIPLYVKQISPRQISTKLGFIIFEKLFVLFGVVFCFGYNTIMLKLKLDEMIRWRIVVTANVSLLLLLIVLILFKIIPESPISLIKEGNEEEARRVIGYFYPSDMVDQTFQMKKRQVENSTKPQSTPTLSPNQSQKQTRIARLKTFLTFQLPLIHQLTGVNSYLSNMGFVISLYNLGFTQYIPLLFTGVQFIATILSVFYISRFTPRTIILVGNLGMGLCCVAIAISFLVIESKDNCFWSVIAFLTLLIAFNGATFVPVTGLYVAQVGNKWSLKWSLVLNWCMCGWTNIIFVTIVSTFGFATVFFIFGIITMIGFVINLVWMIETKPTTKEPSSNEHSGIELKPRKQKLKTVTELTKYIST